jgi:hypothetical protein
MDIGNVQEEALIGRARYLTKKIQVVAQTCWTSSQEWHGLLDLIAEMQKLVAGAANLSRKLRT